ncbi:TetR/AcrR family transcriptional regulator [Shimia sp. MMG029]|uniref:TetR/AcrR family transcriptional regulator n=1 Tax=Shimia sp. MMG029 TaxID=3021978 RepID=UPI0022FE76DA|nr:TetR/AcrR family transcriptional regulator [Shimia sp. MMG029]MDA5559045.1 TetR/AcrR family transcriptional regulator [Shimia sp. MMG029]
MAEASTKKRKRDAEATKARILVAAKKEFAKSGLGGARVDEIAERANANKRMIYHYFGSKEDLFRAVLEEAYLGIREAEKRLKLDDMAPSEALEKLVRFTWTYYLKNPEFITLVNSENLHRAKHLKGLKTLPEATRGLVDLVSDILKRGEESGEFRPGIDATQLNITIAAIGYYYLTNRFTGSYLFDRDMMDTAALDARLDFNVDTIMRLVAAE